MDHPLPLVLAYAFHEFAYAVGELTTRRRNSIRREPVFTQQAPKIPCMTKDEKNYLARFFLLITELNS